ncbi:hypothetical protein [Bilophila sp.]|uniref:hypothetical protein n=1 Tax=Bilophila sp. TaxID=1929485 RepID=UPI003077C4DB
MITSQRRLKEALASLHDAPGRKRACGAGRLPIRKMPQKWVMEHPAFFSDGSKGFGKNFDVGCSCRFCKKDTSMEKNGIDVVCFMAFSPAFSRKAPKERLSVKNIVNKRERRNFC